MPGQKLWSATVALALRSVRYSRNPKRGRTGASHSSRGLPSANVSLFACTKGGCPQRAIPSFSVFLSASPLSADLSVFFACGGACVIEPHACGSKICRPFAPSAFVSVYAQQMRLSSVSRYNHQCFVAPPVAGAATSAGATSLTFATKKSLKAGKFGKVKTIRARTIAVMSIVASASICVASARWCVKVRVAK